MTESTSTEPTYRSRVTRKRLNSEQPELQTPEVSERSEPVDLDGSSNSKWLWRVLFLTVSTVVSFAMADAILFVLELADSSMFAAGFLGVLLFSLTLTVFGLLYREWSSYYLLKRISTLDYSLNELMAKDDVTLTLAQIKRRQKFQSSSPFVSHCYNELYTTLKPHHTNAEVLALYRRVVIDPVNTFSRKVLKTQSYSAGGIAFISPNGFIQSLGLLWMSMRTLAKIAQVYGFKPGISANYRLLRLAMENLAASSLVDLLADEFTKQVGSVIGEKVLEKSTEAIAVGALNQRLGRALMRELNRSIYE